jgi:hypothetical protein
MSYKKAEKPKTGKGKVLLCPRCGSDNVKSNPYGVFSPVIPNVGGIQEKCMSCGYVGQVFVEVPRDKIPEFRKKLKEREIKA